MFYRTLAILLLSLVLAHSEEPPALPDYAGIYPTNTVTPSFGLLASLAPGAKINESKEGDVTVFRCDWADVSVKIRVDPHFDQAGQIKEMKRLITYMSREQKGNPVVAALIKKLEATTNCFGCIITPRFDAKDKAVNLLLALTGSGDGLIFANHTFYDATGSRIYGTEGDPARVQYTK